MRRAFDRVSLWSVGALASLLLVTAHPRAAAAPPQGGAPDLGFGSGGRVETDFKDPFASGFRQDHGRVLLVQRDRKIVVAGDSDGAIAVGRYEPSGLPDSGFGARRVPGTILSGELFKNLRCVDAVLQRDGKILVLADASPTRAGSLPTNVRVLRFLADGSPDPEFGPNGGRGEVRSVSVWFGTDWQWTERDREYEMPLYGSYGVGIRVQSDGKIVVAGRLRFQNDPNRFGDETEWFALARLEPDGRRDPLFPAGVTARVHTSECPAGMALQDDDKIVVAGSVTDGTPAGTETAVFRYEKHGVLDQSFGRGGRATITIGRDGSGAECVRVQRDGKILVGGSWTDPAAMPPQRVALARLWIDGSVDIEFGGLSGRVAHDIPGAVRSIAIAPDFTFVAAVRGAIFNDAFHVVAFDCPGSVAQTFGADGFVGANVADPTDTVQSVALQDDGRILATGWRGSMNFNQDLVLCRYEFHQGAAVAGVGPMLYRSFGPAEETITAFDNGMVYASWLGSAPGGGGFTFRVHGGTTRVTHLADAGQGGVFAAFEDGRVTWSPDARDLGAHSPSTNTVLAHQGGAKVTAITAYRGGVLTAFEDDTAWFSPTPTSLTGGGATQVSQGARVLRLLVDGTTVYSVFEGGAIWRASDGRQGLASGTGAQQVYSGTQGVAAMLAYGGGVLTAFHNRHIYFSPNGENLGGGGSTRRMTNRSSRPQVRDLIAYDRAVLVAYDDEVILSPDGENLEGGGASTSVYQGFLTPRKLLWRPYSRIVFTSFGWWITYSPDGRDLGATSTSFRVYPR